MTTVEAWGTVTVSSLQGLWDGLISILPAIVGALLVLIIGWVVAISLGRLATQILRAFRVDQAVERIGAKKGIEKAGYKFNVADLFGDLVKWFLIIVFVLAAADILGLPRVSDFLTEVLLYIPNIVVAVVILSAGVLLANFLAKLVRGSVKVAGLASSDLVATVVRWSVLVFSILVALDQLGVAQSVIGTLINGLVAMLAIAGGLAFGLGGREAASDFIKKVRQEINE